MTKVIIVDYFGGQLAYPECPYAGKFEKRIPNCKCTVLQGTIGLADDGAYWCSVANKYNVCPFEKLREEEQV